MIKCLKCKRSMFVDRQYSSVQHIEVFCLYCGSRKFFHPPQDSQEGRWILLKETLLAKNTITSL
jgi:DNA-directed RNA polymerase subunit RPC12/RpoP